MKIPVKGTPESFDSKKKAGWRPKANRPDAVLRFISSCRPTQVRTWKREASGESYLDSCPETYCQPSKPHRSHHESGDQYFVVIVEKRGYISSVPVEGAFWCRVAGLKRRNVE